MSDNVILAKMRLKDFLSHLKEQFDEAETHGVAKGGLVVVLPNGTERIVSTFDIAGFMGDVDTVVYDGEPHPQISAVDDTPAKPH